MKKETFVILLLFLAFSLVFTSAFVSAAVNSNQDSNKLNVQNVEATKAVLRQQIENRLRESGGLTEEQIRQQAEARLGQVRIMEVKRIMDVAGNVRGVRVRVEEDGSIRMEKDLEDIEVGTTLDIEEEVEDDKTRLKATLSNGRNAEIKVMPDVASERAIERLRLRVCSEENDCTIELKEVGQGEQSKAAYEVKAQKQARILGLFKKRMEVQAQVNAENGEIIKVKKPWWAFLASETDEVETTVE